MKTFKGKIGIGFIIVLALIALLSSVSYAEPFTSIFTGGLVKINDFFAGRQYEPYSSAIDFFFFAFLFIAIYMMGARYAFKEIKRPEQTIVILLGLMTAFLLVLGWFSMTILLPYVHWILYVLLFTLFYWLLKFVKNGFWRFIFALLLTLLTIALFQGIFDFLEVPEEPAGISAPSFGFLGESFNFLKDSFRGIEMPGVSAPGIPESVKKLFGSDELEPVPTGPTGLPPAGILPEQEISEGLPWWAWALMILAVVLIVLNRKKLTGLLKKIRKPAGHKLIGKIEFIIKEKREIIEKINGIQQIKTAHINSEAANILQELVKIKDAAYIWEEMRKLKNRENPLKKLQVEEEKLIEELKKLYNLEVAFSTSLNKVWVPGLARNGIPSEAESTGFNELIAELNKLIAPRQLNVHDNAENKQQWFGNLGILRIIITYANAAKRKDILAKKLDHVLYDTHVNALIKENVNNKFKNITRRARHFRYYDKMEQIITLELNHKITVQIEKLEELKAKIEAELGEQETQQAQQGEAPEEAGEGGHGAGIDHEEGEGAGEGGHGGGEGTGTGEGEHGAGAGHEDEQTQFTDMVKFFDEFFASLRTRDYQGCIGLTNDFIGKYAQELGPDVKNELFRLLEHIETNNFDIALGESERYHDDIGKLKGIAHEEFPDIEDEMRPMIDNAMNNISVLYDEIGAARTAAERQPPKPEDKSPRDDERQLAQARAEMREEIARLAELFSKGKK